MNKQYQSETYSVEGVTIDVALKFLDTHRKLLEDAGFKIKSINLANSWFNSADEDFEELGYGDSKYFEVFISGIREYTNE